MYTPSDTRLVGMAWRDHYSIKNWRAKMQPLFESFPGTLLKSGVGPLARCGNHQEIISRRFEQTYTSSDTTLEWSAERPLFE